MRLLILTILLASGSARAFEFVGGKTCGPTQKLDASFCKMAEPKPWTAAELNEVQDLAFLITHSSRLSCFVSKVSSHGFAKVFRYTYGAYRLHEHEAYVRADRFAMWVYGPDLSINIADRFFAIRLKNDPVSGYPIKQMIFMHELVHAFDVDLTLAMGREFLQLVGFEPNVNGSWHLRNVDSSEIDAQVRAWLSLNTQGREAEGYRAMRTYAMARGYPSAYAMTNPVEMFAELAAHLAFDPLAERYMDPRVVTWFDRNVFTCPRTMHP